MSPFHARTARPISTKFCTDLPTNSGKVLNTSTAMPTQPLVPGVPQFLKPKWVTEEKTLCNKKCPDGYLSTIYLISQAALGPGLLVYNDKCCFSVLLKLFRNYQLQLFVPLLDKITKIELYHWSFLPIWISLRIFHAQEKIVLIGNTTGCVCPDFDILKEAHIP